MRFSILVSLLLLVLTQPSWAQDKDIQDLVDGVRDRSETLQFDDIVTNEDLLEDARKRVDAGGQRPPQSRRWRYRAYLRR